MILGNQFLPTFLLPTGVLRYFNFSFALPYLQVSLLLGFEMSFKPDFSNPLHQRRTNVTDTLHEASALAVIAASSNTMGIASAESTMPGSSNIIPTIAEVGPSSGCRTSLTSSQHQHRGQHAHNIVSRPLKKNNQNFFGRHSHTFLHGRRELFDAQIRNNLGPLRRLLLGDKPVLMTQQLPESSSPSPGLNTLPTSLPSNNKFI